MSDFEIAIERLTAWIRDYGHAESAIFIGDLSIILLAAKESVLKNAEIQRLHAWQEEVRCRLDELCLFVDASWDMTGGHEVDRITVLADRFRRQQAEIERLQVIVDKLPKRDDKTYYEEYRLGPNSTAWCVWRVDEYCPWQVSPGTVPEDSWQADFDWQIPDADYDDVEIFGVYATKEAAEKARDE